MASFLIPSRPHTSFGTKQGDAYFAHCKEVAQAALKKDAKAPKYPLYPAGFVSVTLDLYFALAEDAPKGFAECPERWGEYRIPRADKAGQLIVSALKGVLYADARQVQLAVNRRLFERSVLARSYGPESKRGCAVVHYAPCVSSLEAAFELETGYGC